MTTLSEHDLISSAATHLKAAARAVNAGDAATFVIHASALDALRNPVVMQLPGALVMGALRSEGRYTTEGIRQFASEVSSAYSQTCGPMPPEAIIQVLEVFFKPGQAPPPDMPISVGVYLMSAAAAKTAEDPDSFDSRVDEVARELEAHRRQNPQAQGRR